MIALVEGANRQKTPNEIALNILLAGLSIVLLLATATIQPFAKYSSADSRRSPCSSRCWCASSRRPSAALLSAIGIAGMDRLVQRNVLAMSGRAVEAAGDVATLLLDKTGTITYGNRMAAAFLPVGGVDERDARVGRAAVEPGRRDTRGTLDRATSPKAATRCRRRTSTTPSWCRSPRRPA